MKIYLPIFALILLQGCATPPLGSWAAFEKVDEFTDTRVCSVSVGSLYYKNVVATYSGSLYPYIEVVNGDLRVGIKSGGKFNIPVGDVQIRIDANPAWKIITSETPVDYIPEGIVGTTEEYTKALGSNLSEDRQKEFESTYQATMKTIYGSISPFTATTGEKARSILKEMVSGKKIKYRTLGINQPASTTGEYDLDPTFKASLSQCGIELTN